eukprot:TRINITY_DN28955_c0_g1_i1.p1 TRINITY_DN28955_c0_g1~~TRINITY_DN28955_c0_g1_i1.p1  ORF type:complete len:343 (+),score=54.84 TRINITY_DN28955_c0_g1_i1:50-1030(+)
MVDRGRTRHASRSPPATRRVGYLSRSGSCGVGYRGMKEFDAMLRIEAAVKECRKGCWADVGRAKELLECFGYSMGGARYNVDKDRTVVEIYRTADAICSTCLGVQCIEAFYVAMRVTQNTPAIVRFPLSFTSRQRKKIGSTRHKHIVLGYYNVATDSWGGLGKSRTDGLGTADPVHPTLLNLVQYYESGYIDEGHSLEEIRVGSPIQHGQTPAYATWVIPRNRLATQATSISAAITSAPTPTPLIFAETPFVPTGTHRGHPLYRSHPYILFTDDDGHWKIGTGPECIVTSLGYFKTAEPHKGRAPSMDLEWLEHTEQGWQPLRDAD